MKKKTQFILILILFPILLFGQKDRTLNKDTLSNWTQAVMKEYEIPGMVISVFSGDSLYNIAAEGVRRIGTNDLITKYDKFHIGSCGKAITGFIAGRLVEKDLISWDTKVLEIFPELENISRPEYKNIDFNDVLSNHSGVRPFTEDEEWEKLIEFDNVDNKQKRYDFTKWLLQQQAVEIDSVKKHSYSNAGFSIAAAMMEKVAGTTWEELVENEFAIPLQIQPIIGWPGYNHDNQPWGHWIEEGDSILTEHSPYHEYKLDNIITPAGNYSLSIGDYTKFLQLNLKGLNGKDTILKSSTYNFLHYCNFDPNIELFGFYSIGWAAFKVPPEKSMTISTHAGSAGTFYCLTVLYKEPDFGMTIIANAGTDLASDGVKKIKNKIEKHFGLR